MATEDAEIRHLLARTGFGAPTQVELEAFAGLSFGDTVDQLLGAVSANPVTAPPEWLGTLPQIKGRNLSRDARKQITRTRTQHGKALKGWWYAEMMATPTPFTERLVLFWHNHFTSSMKKVKFADYLYDQNALFRAEALGNFADLLRSVTKDPAMMAYLDTAGSKRDAPNENFARELMELFTLGEGHVYTEDDIREAARAFTGWDDTDDRRMQYRAARHDPGRKTFLGQTGRFDADDIIDILLAQPRVAEFITEKLWREFISGDPDPADIALLAAMFRDSGYELRPLVQALLVIPQFRDGANHGTLVKSPVELVVGTYRLIGLRPTDGEPFSVQGRNLGQDVFDPPNVKGWPGGPTWINTAALPKRYEFLRDVSGAIDQISGGPPLQSSNRRFARAMRNVFSDGLVDEAATRSLLEMPPVQLADLMLAAPRAAAPGVMGAHNAIGDLLLDPVYQLK